MINDHDSPAFTKICLKPLDFNAILSRNSRISIFFIDMELTPIGQVRSPIKSTPKPEYDWQGVISEIVVVPGLTPGLAKLDESSHIIVIYWAHQATNCADMALTVRYRGDPTLPMVGVFASRSLHRPNPLGQKVAKILGIQGNVIKVEGLDALDGTPVLDIKPFIPRYDAPDDATATQWQS